MTNNKRQPVWVAPGFSEKLESSAPSVNSEQIKEAPIENNNKHEKSNKDKRKAPWVAPQVISSSSSVVNDNKVQNNSPSQKQAKSKVRKEPWISDNYRQNNSSSPKHRCSPTELTAELTDQISKGTYECMVCFDKIGKRSQIWNCTTCWHMFHINCISRWSQASNDGKVWRCPACQTQIVDPPSSFCFCRKSENPKFDPYGLPHSCGSLCGKIRANSTCPHPCNLICHPGPCPPCSAMAPPHLCPCGRTSIQLRCGQSPEGKTCENKCYKKLNCGKHRCELLCHEGPCPTCKILVKQNCFCGDKINIEKECGSCKVDFITGGSFSCGKICDKLLDCGNHKCQQVCHQSECSSCSSAPSQVRKCPCGKTDIEKFGQIRTSCLDPIPTCAQTCNKRLSCGHLCPLKCHIGSCPPCEIIIEAQCRCGTTTQKVSCWFLNGPRDPNEAPREVTCNTKCEAMKHCGRHRCLTVCCPSKNIPSELSEAAHPCQLVCGRTLQCKLHTCTYACHRGKCPPCLNTSFYELTCKCGKTVLEPPIPCGTKPPVCEHPCTREHSCNHKVLHNCHSEEKCPPCTIFVERECVGGHEIRKNVPCHFANVSCGRKCLLPLSCGIHLCEKSCHAAPCQQEAIEGQPCQQKCLATLPICGHQCQELCHVGKPCPDIPCKEMVNVYCLCRRRFETIECGATLTTPSPVRVIPCDEQCVRETRIKQLAEAFGRSEGCTDPIPTYSPFLVHYTLINPKFASKVDSCFNELINDNSKQRYAFPPMQRNQRQYIHELAQFYGFESVSHDREPQRNVAIYKRKDSKIPTVTLMKLLSNPKFRQELTRSMIFISNLPENFKTDDVVKLFSGFQLTRDFHIIWIDDTSIYVFINDQQSMSSIIKILRSSDIPFNFKIDPSIEASNPITPIESPSVTPSLKSKTPKISKSQKETESPKPPNIYSAFLDNKSENKEDNLISVTAVQIEPKSDLLDVLEQNIDSLPIKKLENIDLVEEQNEK